MHFNTSQRSTISSESPPACPGSATRLVSSGLPAQGDFLFSDDPIVNWFDSQDEVTARFWIDCAADFFGLPDSDSATPRQCWHAFLLFANTGVLAPPPLPVLVTHSAVVRKYGPLLSLPICLLVCATAVMAMVLCPFGHSRRFRAI